MSRNRSKTFDSSESKSTNEFSSRMNMKSLTTKTNSFELVDPFAKSSTMKNDVEKKRTGNFHQPEKTNRYTVENRDTIEKVALRFNSTPSEIIRLNKLISRTIFPGQILFVPNKTITEEENFVENTEQTDESPVENLAVSPPFPGRIYRLNVESSLESFSSESSNGKNQEENSRKFSSAEAQSSSDDETSAGFCKCRAFLIVENRKTISGTLLVTQSALLFDPDRHEPILDLHGFSRHALLLRMENLANIATYDDLSLYDYRISLRENKKRRNFRSISVEKVRNPNFDKLKPTKTFTNQFFTIYDRINSFESNFFTNFDDFYRIFDEFKNSINFLCNEKFFFDFDLLKFQQALRIPQIEQLDGFFFGFDFSDFRALHHNENNYFPMSSIEFPFYLRVIVRNHISDNSSLQPINKTKENEYFHRRKYFKEEFWFSVPREKHDSLLKFFLRWTPMENSVTSLGFVLLVNDDPELSIDSPSFALEYVKNKNDNYLKTRKSLIKDWEIISGEEISRRFNGNFLDEPNLVDSTISAPKLIQKSSLIDETKSKKILIELPARFQALDWFLSFSTEANGFSLNQLYRRSVERDRDEPSLLIIKDVEKNIFGAFISHQIMISEGFYGNGETFLFTFTPHFRVFRWTGSNEFFVKGDLNSLGIGTGDGKFGLWIDGDLNRGRTCATRTFENDPLTPKEDFVIANVELWTFVD